MPESGFGIHLILALCPPFLLLFLLLLLLLVLLFLLDLHVCVGEGYSGNVSINLLEMLGKTQ